MINDLQSQLIEQGKNTQSIKYKIENEIFKQQIALLEEKNTQLLQRLEKKKEKTEINRSFESFRIRILDTPWRNCLEPVTKRFPEFENLVSLKICEEFPLILYKLQHQILDLAFAMDKQNKGYEVVERTDEEGKGTRILVLQIFYPTTITEEQIIQFYHHGMIDYLEVKDNRKTEDLLNKL